MRGAIGAVLVLVALASQVDAQPRASSRVATNPQPGAARSLTLMVSGGALVAAGSLEQSFSTMINAEEARVATALSNQAAPFAEAGLRVSLTRRIGASAVGFVASGNSSGRVDAEIPHPFYFDQLRHVSGGVSRLRRREIGVHLDLEYAISINRHVVQLFAGPSLVRLEQALVTGVEYTDAYPYDTASFTGTTNTVARGFAPGFNAGAETTWRMGRTWHMAALLRYSRTPVTWSPSEAQPAEAAAGGLQLGLGLRIPF